MISLEYFGILVISVILYWLIPKQSIRNFLLVLSSLAFIYLLDKWSVVVVVLLTILSYCLGTQINRKPQYEWVHSLGVVLVLGVLIVFKYLGFLSGIYNSLAIFVSALPRFEIRSLLLPLGISYIVFKHISYLTDIKWGLVKPGRFIDFLLYSSLFTIFVAGPIERFERFKPQVEQSCLRFTWANIDYGFMRIGFGIFKKLVLADWIGFFINPVWQNPSNYTALIRVLALIGYSFQIYFDFSGYSDIAIGSSRLFGLRIMENFNSPYLAPNISQFWRRWHISLSDWIRDYLFFPLSQLSKKNLWQKLFVPVIAMALCGLWHGSAWNYILWGLWHGVGIYIFQSWVSLTKKKRRSQPNRSANPDFGWIANIATFVWITAGWVFFVVGGLRLANHLLTLYSIMLLMLISACIVLIMRMLIIPVSTMCKNSTSAVYLLVLTALLFCSIKTPFIYNAF